MTGRIAQSRPHTSLLDWLHADADAETIFAIEQTVDRYLRVEEALAEAQADCGLVPRESFEAIATVRRNRAIDLVALRERSQLVGYPILPLVRLVDAELHPAHRGILHLGATTQDIMDTALSMSLVEATDLLISRVTTIGDLLAALVNEHAATVMSARTHAQQAVPTSLGAKLAVFLDELTRHRRRLIACREEVRVVSLFGAGGTNAGQGESGSQVRARVAQLLGLRDVTVPWHVARDRVAHLLQVAAGTAGTVGRFGQEIIDLARTEIGEVHEAWSPHRGASSTMPQKANPISSEACVGLADVAAALASGTGHLVRAGHERAAGQWHAEWKLVPETLITVSSALVQMHELVAAIRVDADRMKANLALDNEVIMAEAYMMALAPQLGRETAHDVVYDAVLTARSSNTVLAKVLSQVPGYPLISELVPSEYLGEVEAICSTARNSWEASRDA